MVKIQYSNNKRPQKRQPTSNNNDERLFRKTRKMKKDTPHPTITTPAAVVRILFSSLCLNNLPLNQRTLVSHIRIIMCLSNSCLLVRSVDPYPEKK